MRFGILHNFWWCQVPRSDEKLVVLKSDNSTPDVSLGFLNRFFGEVVPIHLWPVFCGSIFSRLFWTAFYGSHTFPCQSLLLSAAVLNDIKAIWIGFVLKM